MKAATITLKTSDPCVFTCTLRATMHGILVDACLHALVICN